MGPCFAGGLYWCCNLLELATALSWSCLCWGPKVGIVCAVCMLGVIGERGPLVLGVLSGLRRYKD